MNANNKDIAFRLAWKCNHNLCPAEQAQKPCPLAKIRPSSAVPDIKPDCKKVTEEDWKEVLES